MLPFSWSSIGFFATALLFSLCSSSSAADYYSWTDERGSFHVSDSLQNVPEKYRDQIDKKVYTQDAPSPSQPPVTSYQGKRPSAPEQRGEKSLKRFEVPYRAYEGSAKRVIVSVVFNNSVTALMAIDTGAPETVISTSLAQRLGLFNEDQGRLIIRTGGIGGSAPAVRSIIDSIQVGGVKSEFVPTTVINPISSAFEGLLGLDFVTNYSMLVDSKRRMVAFEELPGNPDQPGGHDREWWIGHFMEFANYRAQWKTYSDVLEKKIHDSMRSIGNDDVKRKAFADNQVKEAEKLLEKLDRYASQNSVPREWRQ